MTREEQCKQAAAENASIRYPEHTWHKHEENSVSTLSDYAEEYFIQGCEWADANRWVKVEDGLPEPLNPSSHSGFVIGEDVHGWPEVVRYNHTTNAWYNQKSGIIYITRWSPFTLPSPPKAEQ